MAAEKRLVADPPPKPSWLWALPLLGGVGALVGALAVFLPWGQGLVDNYLDGAAGLRPEGLRGAAQAAAFAAAAQIWQPLLLSAGLGAGIAWIGWRGRDDGARRGLRGACWIWLLGQCLALSSFHAEADSLPLSAGAFFAILAVAAFNLPAQDGRDEGPPWAQPALRPLKLGLGIGGGVLLTAAALALLWPAAVAPWLTGPADFAALPASQQSFFAYYAMDLGSLWGAAGALALALRSLADRGHERAVRVAAAGAAGLYLMTEVLSRALGGSAGLCFVIAVLAAGGFLGGALIPAGARASKA